MFQTQEATDLAYGISLAAALLGAGIGMFLAPPVRGARSFQRALMLAPLMGLAALLCFRWIDAKLPGADEGLTAIRVSGSTRDELMSSIRRGTTFNGLWSGARIRGDLATFLLRPSTHNIDVHPPLYFLMARIWAEVFGSDIVTLRGLSALMAVLTVPAIAWFSLEAFACWRSAFLAAAFVAVSPFQAVYSQEARMYTLLGLLTVLSSAALLRAQRRPSGASWTLFASMAMLGMLTHALFGLALMAQAAFVVIRGGPERRFALLGCAAGAIAALPWLANVVLQRLDRRMGWLLKATVHEGELVATLRGLGTALTDKDSWTPAAGAVLLVAVVAVAAWRGAGLLPAAIALICTFAPWVTDIVMGGRAAGVPRYFGIPGLIALVALGRVAAVAIRGRTVAGLTLSSLLLAFSCRSASRAATAASVPWSKGGGEIPRCVAALEARARPTIFVFNPGPMSNLIAMSQATIQEVSVDVPAWTPPVNDAFVLGSTPRQRLELAASWGGRFESVTETFQRWVPAAP